MEHLNKIELRGRVGTVRFAQAGDKTVCHLSVATSAVYRNQTNATVEETTWHNCTLWSSKKYPDLSCITVGAPIALKGRFKNTKYTGADGQDKYSSEVAVYEFEIIPAEEQLKPENLL